MPKSESGVSLREHLEASLFAINRESSLRWEQLSRNTDDRFRSLQESLNKSEIALNIRLQGMNAIREQLGVQKAEFATNERVDNAVATMRTLHDALSTNLAQSEDALRLLISREADNARERQEKEGKTQDEAINAIIRQMSTFLTNDRAEAIMAEGRTRMDLWRETQDRDGQRRDDALSHLNQQYAGLMGRIAGMGIIVVLTSLALQIIFWFVAHH